MDREKIPAIGIKDESFKIKNSWIWLISFCVIQKMHFRVNGNSCFFGFFWSSRLPEKSELLPKARFLLVVYSASLIWNLSWDSAELICSNFLQYALQCRPLFCMHFPLLCHKKVHMRFCDIWLDKLPIKWESIMPHIWKLSSYIYF